MKWIKLFAAVVMLFGICCVAQTSPIASSKTVSSSAGYTLTLASLPNSIQIGLPVNITVTVKNVTDADIYWSWDKGKDMAYKGFRFLLMKDGREVETTVFHRKITGRQRQDDPVELGPSSSVAIPYPPGTMFGLAPKFETTS